LLWSISYIDLSLGDQQMAKPNLSSMSIDALLKLREDINEILLGGSLGPKRLEISPTTFD
jgi:hypothetical protein